MLGVIDSSFSFAIGDLRGRLAEAKAKNEKGFVLVFCSITLLVLTSLGGFAVDVGNWYWNASRNQNAADAASLAGATYLPGDVESAIAAATESLRQNGFSDIKINDAAGGVHGGTGEKKGTPTAYISQDKTYPNRLRVEVGSTVNNYFTSLLGYNQQTLVRSANAFYQPEIQTGSPGVVLGAEPASLGTVQYTQDYNGKYWLNIAGGQTAKANGDKYTAMGCAADVDGCAAGKNTDIQDEASRSHQYIVHVPAGVTGPISLQVFDGAFVDVGNTCDVAQYGVKSGLPYGIDLKAADLNGLAASFGKPAGLYASGTGEYCTGDASWSLNTGAYKPPPALSLTTYDVSGVKDMDITKGKKIDIAGPVAATTKTYPSVTVKDTQSLATQLKNNEELRDTFRQWHTFAVLYPTDITVAHDYIIEARTPLDSLGNNHFSLRIGAGLETGMWNKDTAKKMSLSSKGHFTIYTNANATDLKSFYFAKMTSAQAGRTIDLNLFDVGDGDAPLQVNLLAPKNATGVGVGFGKCQQLGPRTATVDRNPCAILNASKPNYDGRNVTLRFTVPSTYRCNDMGGASCWMGLQFVTSAAVYDTTTWEILDCGRPLRLIPDGAPDVDDTCPSPSGAVGTTTAPPTTTSTTIPKTTTTKKPTPSTVKPTTTTKKPSQTSTTKKPATTTQKPPTPTTKPPTTTTKKPQPTTTRPPATTTTIYIGGT